MSAGTSRALLDNQAVSYQRPWNHPIRNIKIILKSVMVPIDSNNWNHILSEEPSFRVIDYDRI